MLSISGVTKRYGKTLANDNISFAVGDGQIGILLGPTGRGNPPSSSASPGFCGLPAASRSTAL